MIKDGQVRSLRRWLGEGCTLREAARRCGMDEKTARTVAAIDRLVHHSVIVEPSW